LEKFRAIIAAQGGDPSVRAADLHPGTHIKAMKAPHDGPVVSVDNKALVRIARAAGSPQDKGAGLVLHVRPGMQVHEDQPLYTIYAESASRLAEAVLVARQQKPYQVAAGGVYGFVE
jgi:AMP phosphorylase